MKVNIKDSMVSKKIFVKKDQDGKIIAISKVALPHINEEMELDAPEVIAFLSSETMGTKVPTELLQSDLQLIRVLEDLIEILIEKNIIRLTELPEAAQSKLLSRKKIRNTVCDFLTEDTNFDDNDDDGTINF